MKKVFFWFFILSWFLIFSWFRGSLTVAGGEESFSIFNSTLIIEQISLWQRSGTGYPLPFYSTRLLPVLFNVVLTQLEMPSFLIQAFFYFFILLSGFAGTFLLTRFLFKKENNPDKISLLAALFYVFNLYALSQIFNRFLYSGMFLWAYLPIFLLLWIKWCREGSHKYLIVFLTISLLYSLSYLQPAHLITLWSPAAVWFLIWVIKKHIPRKKAIILALLGFLSWVIVNVWWLYPYAKLSNLSVTEISSWQANFDSLRGVSQYFPTREILLLRQSYLFGENSPWFNWYNQPWVWLVSVLVLVIAVAGWISSRKMPSRRWLTTMALVGWFVSKGSNSPFGYGFFSWLFSNFPFTAALRNPYEKFGIVWLLPYSIFFALGLMKIKNKFARIGILFLTCGVLVWPMWTGDIYRNVRVKVPTYYEEANNFLNEDKRDGRILALPLSPGDAVTYDWGYRGVEPSEFFFDRPSVSKILRAKYFDDKYWSLYDSFVNNKDYDKLLDEMGIRFLVLHDDIISEQTGASTSAQVKKTLKENKNITILEKFGELIIYEYNKGQESPLFTTEGENAPKINYQKLSPQKYKVNIEKISKPFNLIFKETYNNFWEARINGETIKDHFLVYDYANGWMINTKGSYNIEVVFKVWPWE